MAIVENVSGHVVAFLAGKPALLEALDVVSDGTRLDLQANSELRICHYQTRQFLTLRGPLRASISHEGVAVISGKTATVAGESCAAPVSSTFSGGQTLTHYVGLDVSLKLTAICIVDQTGRIEREGIVASNPEAIAAFIKSHALYVARIGLETGATSTWLWTELNKLGLPIICIDARHAKRL